MNKLKMIFHKDLIKYICLHFFCLDMGFIYLSILIGILLITYSPVVILGDIDSSDIAQWIGFVSYITIFLLIMIFLKIFGMIIYYNNDYKRVTNPLVIKLIENLKENRNRSRLWFLFIITLPYNINTIFNMIVSYDWWYQFLEYTAWMYFASAFVPYKILFYYFDTVKYIENVSNNKVAVAKFVIKQVSVFVLLSLSLLMFIVYFILNSKIPGC